MIEVSNHRASGLQTMAAVLNKVNIGKNVKSLQPLLEVAILGNEMTPKNGKKEKTSNSQLEDTTCLVQDYYN